MQRTITVKGIGKASSSPDQIAIMLSLETSNAHYDAAVESASQKITKLGDALSLIGFSKDDLKTTGFNIRTKHKSVKDGAGGYRSIFDGYEVCHSLKLTFDFDTLTLSKTLNAIARCQVEPELNIGFTVKDPSALNEEMLRSATENARRKAEALCQSAGVKLKDLLTIDYTWGELDIFSNTKYDMDECCIAEAPCAAPIDIVPEDINISDTVTFVWAIE